MWRLLLLCLCVLVHAEQKCTPGANGVRTLNGKHCASTTRYSDGHRGACGCGPPGGDTPFDWNMSGYTTAPSQNFFASGGSTTWCGSGCGKCVRLCTTGGFIPGEGGPTPAGQCIIFLVTNDCPYAGNEKWCEIHGNVGNGQHNTFGYEVHFDLQNARGQIDRLAWNNPEVTCEIVSCPGDLQSHWDTCECRHSGK